MNLIKLTACALLSLSTLAIAGEARSPARAQLDGFLAAFNSGDRTTVAAFERDHAPPGFTEPTMQIFAKTGGYDLLELEESGPHAVSGWVRARSTRALEQLSIEVDPARPERIVRIQLVDGNPPAHLRREDAKPGK